MIPNQIERELLIEAPLDVVWSVVTEPAHISRWFSDVVEIDLRPGGRGAFSWKEHGTVDVRVERVERPHLFSFRWVYPEGSEPREGNSMLVEFTLSEEGGNTRLRVVESGLGEVDWAQEEQARYVDDHARGWDGHLSHLGQYMARQRQASAR